MKSFINGWQSKVLIGIFSLFTLWWISLQLPQYKSELSLNLFGSLYGIVALWGAIWSFKIAKHWGGYKSILGKSILFFGIGLLCQEIGQIAYAYYIVILHIEVPYPSIGDFFFYITIPIYTLAVYYLARTSGIRFSLKTMGNKINAVTIPLIMLLLSYFLFLRGYEFDWTKPLTIFLDFAVPLGQAIYISLAILTYLLTKKVLGGVMKNKVLFILVALFAQFAADWTFLYQASQETWTAGGVNDYMFLCAYFIMSLALIRFNTVYEQLRSA